jgi:hypothetical protein
MEATWSRRHWIRWITAIFLAQIIPIWFLSDRHVLTPRTDPRHAQFQLLTDPAMERRLAEALATMDPTLFAAANRYGFSGAAWLNPRQTQLKVADWNQPSFWLAQRPEDITTANVEELGMRPFFSTPVVSKTPPRTSEISEHFEAAPTQSILWVEGPLAGRPLLWPIQLPSWTNSTVLSNTLTEVVVSPNGDTLSARLLAFSGSAAVDLEALRLAKRARFAPVSAKLSENEDVSGPTTVGWLTFRWATIAPSATNTSSR